MKRLVVAVVVLAGCSSGVLRVQDAVVAAPAGDVAAVYLTVENGSGERVSLVGVRTNRGRAEIHESYMEADLMRMRPVASVAIESGATVVFEPGGLHIMLFDLPGLAPGDVVDLTLQFDDGSDVAVSAPVRPITELVP